MVRADWLAECDHHSTGNRAWPFREEAAALEREDRAPELIKPDRNDRRLGLPRDDFVTAPQPQQRSAPGQFALWKKADDFAGANPGDGIAHPVLRFPGRDRDATDGAQDWMEETIPVDAFVDD